MIVAGGGAAGLIAAWRAASRGASVVMIEKNSRLGMKILISGGGKCNLTHAGSMDDLRAQFRVDEARFLNPAFHRFTNTDFLAIMHAHGIATLARPDGRVFPVDGYNAHDVVAALTRLIETVRVVIVTQAPIDRLVIDGGRVRGVQRGDLFTEADSVIVAAGGSSYPATGTTGDGWRWARDAGHRVVPLRAALAPITLARPRPEWSGVALRDVVLRARVSDGGKEYAHWRGDTLFTHKGISGPCALGISREVGEKLDGGLPGGGMLEVDLAPDHSFEHLQALMRDQIRLSPRRTIGWFADGYLPERLRSTFWDDAGVDPNMRGAHIAQRDLNRLIRFVKGWSLGGAHSVPLERGEVVAGGVALDEVDSKTMGSRLVEGLYFCGEVLDIAGPVGGYNLQAAWSTGYLAGEAAGAL